MFISSWSGQCHTLQAWWRSREHLRIVISKLTSVIFTFYIFTFGYVACFDIISVLSLFYKFFILPICPVFTVFPGLESCYTQR